MPIIHVHMLEGRDVAKKRLLAKRLTDVIIDTLGSPPHKVRVILTDMPHDSYAVGGVLHSDAVKATKKSGKKSAKKKKKKKK
jgi:4-oxalocrotonate tautomerase